LPNIAINFPNIAISKEIMLAVTDPIEISKVDLREDLNQLILETNKIKQLNKNNGKINFDEEIDHCVVDIYAHENQILHYPSPVSECEKVDVEISRPIDIKISQEEILTEKIINDHTLQSVQDITEFAIVIFMVFVFLVCVVAIVFILIDYQPSRIHSKIQHESLIMKKL